MNEKFHVNAHLELAIPISSKDFDISTSAQTRSAPAQRKQYLHAHTSQQVRKSTLEFESDIQLHTY